MSIIETPFLILSLSYLLHRSFNDQLYSSSLWVRIYINLTASVVISGLGIHLIISSFNAFDLLWKSILLATIWVIIFIDGYKSAILPLKVILKYFDSDINSAKQRPDNIILASEWRDS